MADKEKKTVEQKTTKEVKKKKTSMRESSAKSRQKSEKPKRVRRAAKAATKPVSSVGTAITKEYHVLPQKDGGKFFTKSRSLVPRYFKASWQELRLVTWPGRKETWKLVFAVFVFSIVLGISIAVLDFGLEKLLREVIL